tara:strand:+ start:160 stop:510 length:351 start_codon:yes stop_codon:yes gene_type:complete
MMPFQIHMKDLKDTLEVEVDLAEFQFALIDSARFEAWLSRAARLAQPFERVDLRLCGTPSAHRLSWSREEDALLAGAIAEEGRKWHLVAKHVPGRSPSACREREARRNKGVVRNRI